MINDSKPKYQTADEAIKVIRDAERSGDSVSVSKDGTLKRTTLSGDRFTKFLFLVHKKLGIETKNQILERKAMIVEVVSKMQREIHLVSSQIRNVNNFLETHIKDLNEFKKDGKVRQLHDQWIILKNRTASAEGGSEQSQSLLNSVGEVAEAITASRPKNTPEDIQKSEHISSDSTKRQQIVEANLCLPASMSKIKNTGEIVKGTLTIPPNEQLRLFDEWREWDTHTNILGKKANDPFIGLSKAFQLDADRMTYVFEQNEFPTECMRDKEAVGLGFKKIAGKNPMRQLILSHLIGQEAVKRMYNKIQGTHPNSDGEAVTFFGTNHPGDTKIRIHMTENKDGDIEIDYLYLTKSQVMGTSQINAEINRSKKFDGPVSQENAATCMTMKIRLKNADLNRGALLFTILEPLKMNIQVELPDLHNE